MARATGALLLLLFAALASATVFITSESAGSETHALNAVHRYLAALDVLKRQGLCGDTFVTENLAAYNATLAKDFDNWLINTHNFAGVFARDTLLPTMKAIATSSSVGASQHTALNPVVTLSEDGKSAFISGRLVEFGRFRDATGTPRSERSASDYTAITVFEAFGNGRSRNNGNDNGHGNDHDDDNHGNGNRGVWRLKQITEIGHMIATPELYDNDAHISYRDWCKPITLGFTDPTKK